MKKYRKKILKQYLGISPVWFDLRKKEISRDKIDIIQWQINMNHLIAEYGTIDSIERKAFEEWEYLQKIKDEEFDYRDFFGEKVTQLIYRVSDADVPPILRRNQDRNWFLAAYPDVFDYLCPSPDVNADDFGAEQKKVDKLVEDRTGFFNKMSKTIVSLGKTNQTITLIRIKNFYKAELRRNFLLAK